MKYSALTIATKAALLGVVLSSGAVTAEQQPEQTPDQGIEKIVVTGQKIDRALQETPTSVAVVTNQQITDENLYSMEEVLGQIANVTAEPNQTFTIRGIDAFNVSGGGNSYLTSVYVDGAVLPYRMIQKGAFTTWDVSQVEVLRGPQSTLQGRNALAGAIVMRTTRPTYEWDGKMRLGIGQNGERNGAVALGGELIENNAAFRFSADKSSHDGQIKNITRGDTSDFRKDETYRLKLLLEPESMEDFSAMFTYAHNAQTEGVTNSLVNVPNPMTNLVTNFNDPTFSFTTTNIYSLEMDYDINDVLSLSSITSHVNSYYGYEWDGDASPVAGAIIYDDRSEDTFSQELRLTYDGDNLQGVMGLYYTNLDVDDISGGQRNISFAELGIPTLLVAPPAVGGFGLPPALAQQVLALYAGVDPVQLNTDTDLTQKVRSMAFYADGTYELNDHWAIFAGIRYDKERQENSSNTQIKIANASYMPDPTNPAFDPLTAQLIAGMNAQLLQMAANASGIEPLVDADFDAWLPKAGVSYTFNDDASMHFTYQKGYRSGGVGTNIARNKTFTYKPEYTTNYELAFRSVWLNGDLVANANVFFLDWKDQQVTVNLSPSRYDTETVNAGKSQVKGFELETLYQATPNLKINAGVGMADTEFKHFPVQVNGTTVNLAGRPFSAAAKWTANLGATYKGDNGIFFNTNANYISSSNEENNPYASGLTLGDAKFDPQNDARTLVNMRLGYEWQKLGVFLQVTNLFNKKYIARADRNWDIPVHTVGKEREISLSFTANFF